MWFARSFAIRSKSKQTILIISRRMQRILIHTSNFTLRLALLAEKLTDFDFIR